MDQEANQRLRERFTQVFGAASPEVRTHIVRAPGRVNLIGEHTDYNEGLVFPMAIEPQITMVCRTRSDDLVKIASTVFPNEFVEFSVQKKVERGKPPWGNYVRGVAAGLIAAGIPLSGMDALVCNTLSVGGGLASSAALELAAARAMLFLVGLSIGPDRLALICQKAEHDYAQVPVGIMDQMIVCAARSGHAMLLDCRDLSKQFVALDPNELRIVVANTMVKHDLVGGEYAMRRRQCEEGVAVLRRRHADLKALRDVTMPQLDASRSDLSEVVFRRCRHVISENGRTAAMAQNLKEQQYDDAGELMVQSHNSLRDDYEVSCPELDFLVDKAMQVKSVYGARMTGGALAAASSPWSSPARWMPFASTCTKRTRRNSAANPACS